MLQRTLPFEKFPRGNLAKDLLVRNASINGTRPTTHTDFSFCHHTANMAAVQDPQQRSTPGPSQTQTEKTNTQSRTGTQAILRLRGAHAPSRPSVRWAEDVVDNEGLGRKSSKGKPAPPFSAQSQSLIV